MKPVNLAKYDIHLCTIFKFKIIYTKTALEKCDCNRQGNATIKIVNVTLPFAVKNYISFIMKFFLPNYIVLEKHEF